jgi:hypothetical protein
MGGFVVMDNFYTYIGIAKLFASGIYSNLNSHHRQHTKGHVANVAESYQLRFL